MVTYSDLFTFVIMLCAVVTLVINLMHKKQRPRPGKIRRHFLQLLLPAVRCTLTNGSLVKYIIQIQKIFVKPYLFFDNTIYLPRQPVGRLWFSDLSLDRRRMLMSDYEIFMIILTTASLIISILTYTHKKQPPCPWKDRRLFLSLTYSPGRGTLTSLTGCLDKYIIRIFQTFVNQ